MAGGALGGDGGLQAGGLQGSLFNTGASGSQTTIQPVNRVTLQHDGDVFFVNSAGTLDFMSTVGWRDGSQVTLVLHVALTVRHAQPFPPAGFGTFQLLGGANILPGPSLQLISFRLLSGDWWEVGR